MPTPTGPRPYTSGHFELVLDGKKTTAFLKSVDGGYPKQNVIDEPTGTEVEHIKHGGTWSIDPITLDFGIAGSYHILKWIQRSWRHDYSTASGEIIHADFNKNSTFVQEFSDAMITETTFPELDGSSRNVPNMKVIIQPEKIVLKQQPNGAKLAWSGGMKQKKWLSSMFRLNIEGINFLDKVSKIESFTIKQSVNQFYTGQDRFPQLTPTGIKYPNLVCHIAEAYAADLLKWHTKNMAGQSEKQGQLTGSLEFLAADRSSLFSLKLENVGLTSYKLVQATANEDKIKRVRFELFVGKMDIEGAKGVGME